MVALATELGRQCQMCGSTDINWSAMTHDADDYLCLTCGHISTDMPPDPEPDMLTACQAEARFGLEEALERLETYKPLIHPPTYDYIVSQITRTIEVLP